VLIVLGLEDASLHTTVLPALLPGVTAGQIQQFQVCVYDNHTLGDSVELIFRDNVSGTEYGRVLLIYDQRCTPTIEPLTPGMNLVSTDCNPQTLLCCCDFEWLPGPNMTGDVTLTAQNVSPGLTVQITPGALTGVGPTAIETFEVCINADHNLLDGFQLVITSSPGGVELGRAQIIYRIRCQPDISDVAGFQPLTLTSTECGGDPIQCCCDIEWLGPTSVPPPGPWTATLENVDGTLQTATISPTAIPSPQTTLVFTVCVNPTHNLGATLDIVLRDATGAEFARLPLSYLETCLPFPGNPSGLGTWNVLCLLQKPGR